MKLTKIIQGFKIVKSASVFEKLQKYAKQGALRGKYLGFPNLHKNYTMSIPGVTDWTGFPRSGKTQVLMEFLITTAQYYDWKHLIYFPDVGNENEILADLIFKQTGKTFDKRYDNHITDFEINLALDLLLNNFYILVKQDEKAKMTPYEFWDLAAEIKQKHGLHTASIDAWKDMRHDSSKFGRDDKYLEDVLNYRNTMAEKYDLHLHTIIHPLKTDKDAQGNRKPPLPYDLKGGTEWYNNGRNMVTVHRAFEEGNKNEVKLYWNKIKPRSIGTEGESTLYLDMKTFRYYWKDGDEEHFAVKEYFEPTSEKIQNIADNQIEFPNDDDNDMPF